jgi:histidyl-tRNA synthetase
LRDAGVVGAAESSVDVLVALLDEASLDQSLAISQRLRGVGLNVETQLEPRKLARQLQYADRAGIRFVVMRGEDEASRGVLSIKDLHRGEQQEVPEAGLIEALRAMHGQPSQAVAEQA